MTTDLYLLYLDVCTEVGDSDSRWDDIHDQTRSHEMTENSESWYCAKPCGWGRGGEALGRINVDVDVGWWFITTKKLLSSPLVPCSSFRFIELLLVKIVLQWRVLFPLCPGQQIDISSALSSSSRWCRRPPDWNSSWVSSWSFRKMKLEIPGNDVFRRGLGQRGWLNE